MVVEYGVTFIDLDRIGPPRSRTCLLSRLLPHQATSQLIIGSGYRSSPMPNLNEIDAVKISHISGV